MNLNVKFEGLTLAKQKMDNMDTQVKKWLVEALEDAAMKIVLPAIRRNIQEGDVVFTGNWLSKQGVRVVIRHGRVDVILGGMGVPYGLNLELGSPPSSLSPASPNMSKIRRWVEQKLGVVGRPSASLSRSIAEKIAKHGVKAHPAILPAWEATHGVFVKEAMSQLADKVARGAS